MAILASILLPALNNARAKSKQAVCANNLKQLGTAIHLYASDWNDVLPRPSATPDDAACWFYAVDPYLLRISPGASATPQQRIAVIKQDPIWLTFDYPSRTNWRTFKMNKKLLGFDGQTNSVTSSITGWSPNYRRLTDISRPTTTPMLFDGRCEEVATSSPDRTRFDGWEVYAGRRHAEGANILFCDGHTEWCVRGSFNTPGGWVTDTTPLNWWTQTSP